MEKPQESDIADSAVPLDIDASIRKGGLRNAGRVLERLNVKMQPKADGSQWMVAEGEQPAPRESPAVASKDGGEKGNADELDDSRFALQQQMMKYHDCLLYTSDAADE